MKEDLLQYIWQFQYFNQNELQTTVGEKLQIQFPGIHNTQQGPDFSEARIKIGDTSWAGSIEVHIRSSDWDHHRHSSDPNFKNVILHVVWAHDKEINNSYSHLLPTLELQPRVSKILLDRYRLLMETRGFIPCENIPGGIKEIVLDNWKQRLLAERMIEKSSKVMEVLAETNFHWEETFWRYIAANFGLSTNSSHFKKMAETLPVAILAKQKNNIHYLEALLFGQAGLLGDIFQEDYPLMLQKEFKFYQTKYKLQPVDGNPFFLRMHPANFPTIRLAQLAVLIHQSEHLFSKIKQTESVKELRVMLQVTANDYWNYHYRFDEETSFKAKTLGSQTVDNIIVNTIVPIIFAYGSYLQEKLYKEKAIYWLETISAEKNFITRGFLNLGFTIKNAFDSQAFIQLKNEYCNKKRCLNCAVGNSLLKRDA